MKKIVIDIGGTYIKWALISKEYEIEKKGKVPTDAFTIKAKGVIKKVADICKELEIETNNQIEGVSISMPGVIDSKSKKSLVPLNFIPDADQLDIGLEFAKHSRLRMEVLNDANAATLGEYHFGSLKDCDNSVLITLGTGIGAGIIVNGQLLLGHNFMSGEIGQHIVNGAKWENMASTRWLVLMSNLIKGETTLTGETVLQLSKSDPIIMEKYDEWMENIAIGLSNLIMILAPKKIAIGGGVSENENFNIERINQLVQEKSNIKIGNPTEIVKASLGNDAALFGAAKFLEVDK